LQHFGTYLPSAGSLPWMSCTGVGFNENTYLKLGNDTDGDWKFWKKMKF
jgi:hypothetical protein